MIGMQPDRRHLLAPMEIVYECIEPSGDSRHVAARHIIVLTLAIVAIAAISLN
jgi:hypothetical protein